MKLLMGLPMIPYRLATADTDTDSDNSANFVDDEDILNMDIDDEVIATNDNRSVVDDVSESEISA